MTTVRRSREPRRLRAATALLIGLGSVLVVATPEGTPASMLPASAASAAVDESTAADTYRNPLRPHVPGAGPRGNVVESCADPVVLRGQQPGDRWWYLYCTTDPLNDEETSGDGPLAFHPVPMMRSRDLVSWTYLGDALTEPPSWAAEDAGLWAPDVVYSRAHDRYYMTFVVTDVTHAVSGEGGCETDSAIGVATSSNPTGPWSVSDTPVVAPRRAGPGCNFFWTYDPDVLGDVIGGSGVLYFGSYYGGVHGQRVLVTPDGMTTRGAPVQVTVGNRYEGTNVVRRGDFHYLFASATNCCNGPLTGYSVFVGRSTSPLGPFVDREGHSLLAGRVGGTPVLSMNGNRWVGTGHSSVFRDAAGQWWTAYHAVDRHGPYFETEPGFTKRPALLDPLDWVDGWPTVRAGRWASDEDMPAPAAQPGDRSRYTPDPLAAHRPGEMLQTHSDEFEDEVLDGAWTWVREPAGEEHRMTGEEFEFDSQAADLYVDDNSASVLSRSAPEGDFLVETRVRLDLPAEGCCSNYVQAGLVLYGGDDSYLKLTHVSIWETRQTEFAKEVPDAPEGSPRYGNTVVGSPSDWTHLRIVREQEPGTEPDRYTAYTSVDGARWTRGGTWTHDMGERPRIGLVSMGGAGFTATFDYVRVHRLAP
jgi:arabinan endo-1,5-alpha-L-arabinosidase